jgi:hypothetical protein
MIVRARPSSRCSLAFSCVRRFTWSISSRLAAGFGPRLRGASAASSAQTLCFRQLANIDE